MNFELSQEQKILQKTVRDFCAREIIPKAAGWNEAGKFPHEIIAPLAGLGVLFSGNRRHKKILIGATVLLLAVLGLFQRQLVTYWLLYQDIDEIAAYHPGDRNYVMGRVTGALIVPRMIAAHPIGGIGLGNYSLMRNDPEYPRDFPRWTNGILPEWDWWAQWRNWGFPWLSFCSPCC